MSSSEINVDVLQASNCMPEGAGSIHRLADDILLDLNRRGVCLPGNRVRMRAQMRLLCAPEHELLAILPIWPDGQSPYRVVGEAILKDSQAIAYLTSYEFDDAVLSYHRNGGKVLTLNTNSRSNCTGCVFCHYSLEESQDPYVRHENELRAYIDEIVLQAQLINLTSIERIGISTGCFREERIAVSHLVSLSKALDRYGFNGSLQFLSSVIRTEEALRTLKDSVPGFHLTLTIECLEHRDTYLKPSKSSLTTSGAITILKACQALGVPCDFTYIIGLDNLSNVKSSLIEMCSLCTEFPKIQVFQPHAAFMRCLDKGLTDTNYYKEFKDFFESEFNLSSMRPKHWHNYRSPWCFEFSGAPLPPPII